MSYADARVAIETWFDAQWGGQTPVGKIDHDFTPTENSVRLTLIDGQALQRSFGKPGANKVQTAGTLKVQIYVAADAGRQAWEGYAQDIEDAFLNRKLRADGTEGANPVIIFSRFGLTPYVSSNQVDPPFRVVTIDAPFVREEAKA